MRKRLPGKLKIESVRELSSYFVIKAVLFYWRMGAGFRGWSFGLGPEAEIGWQARSTHRGENDSCPWFLFSIAISIMTFRPLVWIVRFDFAATCYPTTEQGIQSRFLRCVRPRPPGSEGAAATAFRRRFILQSHGQIFTTQGSEGRWRLPPHSQALRAFVIHDSTFNEEMWRSAWRRVRFDDIAMLRYNPD